jgi:adenylate kinase
MVISKTHTREELEGSWMILVQEEEREILRRQRREEQQDRRNQRLARAAQEQGQY